jgi:thiamine biosynthesis protein ThiI
VLPEIHVFMKQVIIIHYGEIALKGNNRAFFENKLKENIKKALAGIKHTTIRRFRGRMVLEFSETHPRDIVVCRLKKVFGLSHFSFGTEVARDLKAIKEEAVRLMEGEVFESFRVDTRRAQKDFPLTSVEVNREVGDHLQKWCGKRVDLKNAEATCFIEIIERNALVYTRKERGPRGLPVGVSESAVSLLSSGIDSPVASFRMLKRGVKLVYAHFHSQPYTSASSQENAEKLVKLLAEYQFRAKAYFVPFIDIQKEIMAKAPAPLRVLLYRRYMVRLAERIARLEKARALVTGESVGQVASQTISNIRVVGEVTSLPILRPLASFDKEEIVAIAKEIGTFEISTEPYEDCCSLFIPANPATKAHPRQLSDAEGRLELDTLMDEAMARAEVKIFTNQ